MGAWARLPRSLRGEPGVGKTGMIEGFAQLPGQTIEKDGALVEGRDWRARPLGRRMAGRMR